jgi:hypothetical protein
MAQNYCNRQLFSKLKAYSRTQGPMMRAMRMARGALLLSQLLGVAVAYAAPLPDCQVNQAPARCQLYRQGMLSCLDLADGPRRSCEQTYTPDLLCRGRYASACQTLQQAQVRCDKWQGAKRRACLRQTLPDTCSGSVRSPGCQHYREDEGMAVWMPLSP